MDLKYVLGIDELDSQHEGIERACLALQTAGVDGERWRGLLDEIYEKMRFHFHAEESVMEIFAYPETQEHRRSHVNILRRIDGCRKGTLGEADLEAFRDLPMQLFHEQILAQDMRFAVFLTRNKERLGML
ncbi:MAG: hemerythrin domain-containing protein [Propionivibrio sp.]